MIYFFDAVEKIYFLAPDCTDSDDGMDYGVLPPTSHCFKV